MNLTLRTEQSYVINYCATVGIASINFLMFIMIWFGEMW